MRYDVKNLQINRQIVLTKKNKRNTSSEQNVVFPFVLPRKSQTIVKKKLIMDTAKRINKFEKKYAIAFFRHIC